MTSARENKNGGNRGASAGRKAREVRTEETEASSSSALPMAAPHLDPRMSLIVYQQNCMASNRAGSNSVLRTASIVALLRIVAAAM